MQKVPEKIEDEDKDEENNNIETLLAFFVRDSWSCEGVYGPENDAEKTVSDKEMRIKLASPIHTNLKIKMLKEHVESIEYLDEF